MNKKILVFGASNSKNSINQKLAMFAASKLMDVEINEIDLNDYEMPIYSVDRELESGKPKLAQDFVNRIKEADGLIISFAEHNGNYTTAFKNISDWISRVEHKTYTDKPTFLLATSPGGGGAKSVLSIAEKEFKIRGANVTGVFSLPSFNSNFNEEGGISNDELNREFIQKLDSFNFALSKEEMFSMVD